MQGWDLKTLVPLSVVETPFETQFFVGLGEHLSVDQTTGELVCAGQTTIQGQVLETKFKETHKTIDIISHAECANSY